LPSKIIITSLHELLKTFDIYLFIYLSNSDDR